MGEYYRPCTYAKMTSLLKKLGFEIKNCGKHDKAYCSKTGKWTTLPRHKTLSNGVVESICDFLVELDYDKKIIDKYI